MTLARKTSIGTAIKSVDKRQAVVQFSTPDGITPDLDRDITAPDAFTEGAQVVVSPWGHRSIYDGAIPAGVATIHRDGTADIQYLDTDAGRETFAAVKGLGPIVQYSYGFHVLQEGELTSAMRAAGARRYLKRLDVLELSPVVRGAGGPATRTLAVKACGCGAGSTCGCAAESKQQPDPELGRVVRDMQRRAVLAEPLGALALDVADYTVRYFTGGRVQRGPNVKFFDPDGRRAGYYSPREPDSIYVSRGLTPEELVHAVAHETSHWWRCWDPSEESAQLDAEIISRRYLHRLQPEAAA